MNEYTSDWPEIANRRKTEEGWKCERCGHKHEPESGHTLTVHHLDRDKANNAKWNLAVLCQRCHLSVQGRVSMRQMLFSNIPVSQWFQWHLDGYRDSRRNVGEVNMIGYMMRYGRGVR
jgi:hypothetical protein